MTIGKINYVGDSKSVECFFTGSSNYVSKEEMI